MSERVVNLCKLLKEARDKTVEIGGLYQSVETALNDYIEGLPKGGAINLKEEKDALNDLVNTNIKETNVLKLMHMLHCEGR